MGANFLRFSRVQIGVRGRKERPAELTLMSLKTANVGVGVGIQAGARSSIL